MPPRGKKRGAAKRKGKGKAKAKPAHNARGTGAGDVEAIFKAIAPLAAEPMYIDYAEDMGADMDRNKMSRQPHLLQAMKRLSAKFMFKKAAVKKAHKMLYQHRAKEGLWTMNAREQNEFCATLTNRFRVVARHGCMATARKIKWFEKMMAEDCGSSICYSIRILMYVSE